MQEHRSFRSYRFPQGPQTRRRLRALFLRRIARLVRLKARLPEHDVRQHALLDRALCSSLADCAALGIAAAAMGVVQEHPQGTQRRVRTRS